MARTHMFTGGYAWTAASRMRGDANEVAATLATLRDTNGRVDVDAIKAAWRERNTVLRGTMGDEAHVLDIGLDTQAYKILRSLEYEVVNVTTEETEPGGRVYRTIHDLTGDPEAPTRVFVTMPVEAVPLPRTVAPLPPPAPEVPAPVALRPAPPTTPPTPPSPAPARLVADRDMEAWVALSTWRQRYGDIPRYQPVIAAMDALD